MFLLTIVNNILLFPDCILLSGVQAYLAGLTFALAASPCSTPVLATILGYVATSRVCVTGYIVGFNNLLCSLKFKIGKLIYTFTMDIMSKIVTCISDMQFF